MHTLSQPLYKAKFIESNFPEEYFLNLSLAQADLIFFLSQNREQDPLQFVAEFSY